MSNFFCAAPWRGLHINPQGNVKTCCAGNPNMLGNLNTNTIEEILNTEEYLCKMKKKSHYVCLLFGTGAKPSDDFDSKEKQGPSQLLLQLLKQSLLSSETDPFPTLKDKVEKKKEIKLRNILKEPEQRLQVQ